MKRPTMLIRRILLDMGLQSRLNVERDCQVIDSRVECEGISFLTITLPSLCDALDQGLAFGRITPLMFSGFKPAKRGGNLPAFMAGFFMRIFDTDGSLLPSPDEAAIADIRQVTRLFKKVELPCSSARVKRAFDRYKDNDESVFDNSRLSSNYSSSFRAVSGYLWSHLEELSGELYCSPGKFGSGATAERLAFNERHSVASWPVRGDEFFPAAAHVSNREDDVDAFNSIDFHSELEELPVRVVQVPKTLKTPRIISVEPSYMMLRQQSILGPLVNWLESGRLGFKSIRFTDQSVNNELARIGSLDGSLATIDLSDASDLVSNDLVNEVFRSCPTFLGFLQASRSRVAQLPDGNLLTLRKFASMGSGTCFPVEAMIFFTVVMTALIDLSGRRPSRALINSLSAKVAVYGDDIIVPAHSATAVIEYLTAFGLRVNNNKSFTTGLFRESCGGDYYNGYNVTPVYVRQWDFSGSTRAPHVLLSYVSLSNQLYMKGLWNAAQYVRDHIESDRRTSFPRSTTEIGGISFASVIFDTKLRWDRDRSGWRVRSVRTTPRYNEDRTKDVRGAMLRIIHARSWSKPRRCSADGHVYLSVHDKRTGELHDLSCRSTSEDAAN